MDGLFEVSGEALFEAGGLLPDALVAMAKHSAVSGLIGSQRPEATKEFLAEFKPYAESFVPPEQKFSHATTGKMGTVRLVHTTVHLVPVWKVDYDGGGGHFLVIGKDRRVLGRWQWPLMHWPRIIGAVIVACSLAGFGAFEVNKEIVVSGRLHRWTQALLDAVAVAKAARPVAIPPDAHKSAKKSLAETKSLGDSTDKAEPSGKAAGVRPERSAIAKLPGMGLSGIQWKSCPGLLRTMTSRKNVLGKFGPEVVAAAAVEYEKYHCAEWVEAHPAEATINSE